MKHSPRSLLLTAVAVVLACGARVEAQPRRPPARPTGPAVVVRGFADIGIETFAASESFRTIFGTPSGRIVGGGVSIVERHGFFGELRISRFQSTGERVFALNGQVFRLGIANDVSLTPVELTGGVRWDRRAWTAVPYIGAGVGWHRYTESSLGAGADQVSQSFAGFHMSGGVEFPLSRWLAVAGEAQWAVVPNALGGPNSIGAEFGETSLGGTSARAKIVIGRRP